MLNKHLVTLGSCGILCSIRFPLFLKVINSYQNDYNSYTSQKECSLSKSFTKKSNKKSPMFSPASHSSVFSTQDLIVIITLLITIVYFGFSLDYPFFYFHHNGTLLLFFYLLFSSYFILLDYFFIKRYFCRLSSHPAHYLGNLFSFHFQTHCRGFIS